MATKEKVKRNARDYQAWAGFFLDPKLDAEVFATLPGWRQREVLYTREQRAKGHEPSLEELRLLLEGDPTDQLRVSVPDGLTLPSLRRRDRAAVSASSVLDELRPQVTQDSLVAHCTANREGKRLMNDKPAHGLYAYIWALALVRRKMLDTLPLPFYWELEEGIHQMTGKVTTTRVKEAWPLLSWLDLQVTTLTSTVA